MFTEGRRHGWLIALLVLTLAGGGVLSAQEAEPAAAAAPAVASDIEAPQAPISADSAGEEESETSAESKPASGDPNADLPYTLDEPGGKATESPVPDMGKTLARLVLATAVILGALVGGFVIFKRYGAQRLKAGGGRQGLRLVDRLALGPKHAVCLINVAGRYLVVGVAEREMNLLTELDPLLGEETDFNETLESLGGDSRVSNGTEPAEVLRDEK